MQQKNAMQFQPAIRQLHKKQTGETKTFTMRVFEPGDENGIIDCIRDEYQDSYFKRDFYDAVCLRKKAMGNAYVFFVAECEGEIAGMEIFALFTDAQTGEDYIEPASQILRQRYRGYGLAEELVAYTFPLAKAMKPQALFVHAVTFHSITQKVCGAQGMVPTGFRLGSFLAEKMKNSYPKGKCPKHSEGIMILPVEKKDAGLVYLPEEVHPFASGCYEKLHMTYHLCGQKEALPARPVSLRVTVDEVQRTMLIHILQSGENLCQEIQKLMHQHTQPLWTCQVTVPAERGYAITEYEQLKQMGFFFTGLKAACGKKEQFYMQWCGDLELYLDDYTLTEEFSAVRDSIRKFYEERVRA